MNEKLDQIIKELAEIKSLVLTPKRLRNNLRPLEPGETLDRAGDMKRVFNLAASAHYIKKARQHFPQGTYNSNNDRIEIIPRSILVNRCSLRKAFRPREDELGKKTIPDIVNETLDELIERGFFIQYRLNEAIKGNSSAALCIFSKKEAQKVGVLSATMDTSPWVPKKAHSGMVFPGVAQTPLESPNTEQETASEEELIKQMREAEAVGRLDDDVVFEKEEDEESEIERRKL